MKDRIPSFRPIMVLLIAAAAVLGLRAAGVAAGGSTPAGFVSGIRPWHIWVIVAVVLVIVEIFTAGFFILWFGVGAFAAAAVSLVGVGVTGQVIVLTAVSGVLVAASRTIFLKYLSRSGGGAATNVDALIGKEAVVLEAIPDDLSSGRVRVGGEDWSAKSKEGVLIREKDRVIVKAVEGNKLIVEKIDS